MNVRISLDNYLLINKEVLSSTVILRHKILIYIEYVLRIFTVFPINVDETSDDGQDKPKHVRVT
jgi:hypothetical protein